MVVNLFYKKWNDLFNFPTISLDLETLQLYEGQDKNVDTIHIDPQHLNSTFEVYSLTFMTTNEYSLTIDIASFNYSGKRYRILFYISNTIKQDRAANVDEFNNPVTAVLPEYIQVSDGDEIITYKLFTRYQDTYYYKGMLFGRDKRFWISFEAYFKTLVKSFSIKYLDKLLQNMTQPFGTQNLHIIYNFITSTFRSFDDEFVLVPPVVPELRKTNFLLNLDKS